VKFAFIRDHRSEFLVDLMCEAFDVSRSGFYRWLKEPVGRRELRDRMLAEEILDVHATVDDDYGRIRVRRELAARGISVGLHAVERVMRKNGIRAACSKRFRVRTTDSGHDHATAPNLLDRDFTAEMPNQVWLADITYIPTAEGFLYLAGVMDLCSRRIVGWSMQDNLRADLALDALRMAIARRQPPEGLIHHSDRGVQYACGVYSAELALAKIQASMSGKGDCYDNAPMESFWATLKKELVHKRAFATRAEATQATFEWIEMVYNRTRMHSALSYLSPERFEASKAA
jgi:putative transposase